MATISDSTGFAASASAARAQSTIAALNTSGKCDTREPVRCSERQTAEVAATVSQRTGGTPRLAHPARPSRSQPLVAKRRTHAAKRERVVSVGAVRPGRSL
jgi:hypothetical protein